MSRPAITVLLTSQSLARAQAGSGFYRPLTLAPADAASSGGGGEVDDAKAKAAELAKELQNPIAKLISVPIQNNFDFGAGPAGDGFQYKVNVQPVIPSRSAKTGTSSRARFSPSFTRRTSSAPPARPVWRIPRRVSFSRRPNRP